ncbi:MAG TPA: hypothetical protein VFS43_48100 [Polyangiaceae bacterium]|nr:hypothetical protein [Polyangiaceae bacterium]
MRYVERALGVSLDYSPDTLSLLDHYTRSASADLAQRPEARRLVASAVAAYFGEVIRRRYEAWWHAPDAADPEGWQLRFDRIYLAIAPFAFAAAALDPDEAAGEGGLVLDEAERDDVAERLALLPPVDPDEYRLPTTRYDVLEIVVDHLRARAEARGLGDVSLGDADYDDA